MDDIEQKVKQYCDDMSNTLAETMSRFDYPEYRPLWEIFIQDTRNGESYKTFQL